MVYVKHETLQICAYIVDCMPAVRDIYEVLTAFTAGMTVQDVCARLHPRLLGIDERHDINFLLMGLYILLAEML